MIQPANATMAQSSLSQALNKFIRDISHDKTSSSSDQVFGDKNQYKIEIANNLKSRKDAYRLIYDLYRNPQIGFAKHNPSGMWYSSFNLLPDTTTILVRDSRTNKALATLTLVIDSKMGLPLQSSYLEKIKELRDEKRLCAEIISLGFHESVQGSQEILIQLFKYAYLISRGLYDITDLLIMICPRHSCFYEKKLLFEKFGEKIKCKKVNNKFVQLYRLNLSNAEDLCQKIKSGQKKSKSIYKYFEPASNSLELIQKLKKQISKMSEEEVRYFFHEQKNILLDIGQAQLKLLSSIYKDTSTQELIRHRQILIS